MRHLTLASALLLTTGLGAPAFADGHLQIVDEPLELTIQMNHARYPVYDENWPVEKIAQELTGIYLKDATVGANTRNSENDGKTEALNLMLASGEIPDIVGSSLFHICRTENMVGRIGSARTGWTSLAWKFHRQWMSMKPPCAPSRHKIQMATD